jgi:hypothetical protein
MALVPVIPESRGSGPDFLLQARSMDTEPDAQNGFIPVAGMFMMGILE